ncbi:hypothetical protein BJF82_15615 [Kytococcus sp. CUA-901]|nr:hypothetical protein BJF82_15615 [Kytococcus sp. CUA-901]
MSVAGMGAIPIEGGYAFRVWAPNATGVSVIGDFNGWDPEAHGMEHEATATGMPRSRARRCGRSTSCS